MPIAAAVYTRRYAGARLTRHWVRMTRTAGTTSAYMPGSRKTIGSSQTA